jgi:uncharacterized repeat protein (TIGR04042 family)
MPAVHLTLAWPDGRTTTLYSPSTVILEVMQPGQQHTVAELAQRGSLALRRASERVRARYGFACTRAEEEERALLEHAAGFPASAMVTILAAADPPAVAAAASQAEKQPDC